MSPAPAASAAAPIIGANPSLDGAIAPTLLRFALPNLGQIAVQGAVGVLQIYFVGYLGTDALAGVGLAFPLVTLMFAVAGVAIGGGVAAAVARALGAGQRAEAEAVAGQAIALAVIAGLAFSAVMIGFGRPIYRALGGEGAALEAALLYSDIVFGGAVAAWLVNALSAVVRGTGDMATPARIAFWRALLAIPLSALLIFGWGPLPGFGIAGAAIATLVYQLLGVVALMRHLQSQHSPLALRRAMLAPQAVAIAAILRVGGPAMVQVVIMNLTLALMTGLVGHFGTAALAGYGLALRLELLLMSILFALGVGATTMVGTCLGAGRPDRARRITWIGGVLGMAVFELVGLAVALLAESWIGLFSRDQAVIEAGAAYLRLVGPVYGFSGLATMLFFASQGWGRMTPPLIAVLIRVTATVLGGWLVVTVWDGGLLGFYSLLAAIPPVTGTVAALLVWRGTRDMR